jgi:hypothetical protein
MIRVQRMHFTGAYNAETGGPITVVGDLYDGVSADRGARCDWCGTTVNPGEIITGARPAADTDGITLTPYTAQYLEQHPDVMEALIVQAKLEDPTFACAACLPPVEVIKERRAMRVKGGY